MGGEGHMADMNQRIRQNQTLLHRQGERRKNLLKMTRESAHSPSSKDFSAEKWEQSKKEFAHKEQADRRYYLRFIFLFTGATFLLALAAYWIFK